MIKNVFDFLITSIEMENWEHEALENVSSEYYHASRKAESYFGKIQENLPPEMQDTLLQLEDEWIRMETSGMDVYYRKGFSDAVRLILQTLAWEPRRS